MASGMSVAGLSDAAERVALDSTLDPADRIRAPYARGQADPADAWLLGEIDTYLGGARAAA